jgi:hypothetical protein
MADDIPDYMRGFDLDEDWGITPVAKPAESTTPTIDPKLLKSSNLEIAKVKDDVSSIKSMMNEIMQIVSEKETITKEISNEETKQRFKEIEKIVLPFLYRGPIIKSQVEKILKLTRG